MDSQLNLESIERIAKICKTNEDFYSRRLGESNTEVTEMYDYWNSRRIAYEELLAKGKTNAFKRKEEPKIIKLPQRMIDLYKMYGSIVEENGKLFSIGGDKVETEEEYES